MARLAKRHLHGKQTSIVTLNSIRGQIDFTHVHKIRQNFQQGNYSLIQIGKLCHMNLKYSKHI